ncbi:3-hydroxyisobutyrate dehydrogenase-like beta-hydroxyacid dehydrogenase [Herbihabitans rhizosphaerae]|uniref:3-hydroxyisobutyrate dehydrogenase-like beta-hydroxyacid dehydrogenase n=1 Tax=Herbihabitans rhizosphaerae TaxID=1872711 RepID=A0A4Q7KLW6_9PSEU|nr:NAD(P)-dependent oxidoreductase [Herbihabitans rhizosphaerae]RZS36870.1 3-hydroxyisobutyrate dehydrogenase-like beta-hydroxyacid dehydrogenase [Herbihabitans rhizosphaerae]
MRATNKQAAEPVLVIGNNPRSSALATALTRAGHTVTVWAPADPPDAPAAALATARVVVLCVGDYDELWRVLDQVEQPMTGHEIVNLTSGTSAQARQAAARVSALGGQYLDGALMAHPEHVGDEHTVLVYSGAERVFQNNESLFGHWGSATYLGPDAGTASLYDVAMLNFAWATLIGYLHTATLLGAAGVQARTFTPLLTRWLKATVVDVIEDYAAQIDDRKYPGEEEWLELDAPLMDHLVRASEEHGLDAALPELIASLTAKGIDAGRGRESFASLVEVIRTRR